MPHRVVRDMDVFPRMARDMDRHNRRIREAIKKNIASILSKNTIITGDRDKTIRVPVYQLKEYQFAFDSSHLPRVGHGDGLKKVSCPACKGKGCQLCGGLGFVPQARARRIKEWIHEQQHGPFSPMTPYNDLMTTFSEEPPLPLDLGLTSEEEREDSERKGKDGAPRSLPGDRIGKAGRCGKCGKAKGDGDDECDGSCDGDGQGPQGGDEPGQELYETEISIAELENIAFETLELPNLEDKGTRKILREKFRFDEIRKTGPMSALDINKTALANIERNARESNRPVFEKVEMDDLRYRRWEVEPEEEACAVVFAIMDVSGSMYEWKKFIARTFYAWMKRFLETQYDAVEIIFIAHHTTAKEVDEDTFFHRGESGGTHMSSGWKLMNQIIRTRFSPSEWNIYAFHFSDGENFTSDNDDLIAAINETLSFEPSMLGYGEIGEDETEEDEPNQLLYWSQGSMVSDLFDKEFPSEENFVRCKINKNEDVWEALKTFFSSKHQRSLDFLASKRSGEVTPA